MIVAGELSAWRMKLQRLTEPTRYNDAREREDGDHTQDPDFVFFSIETWSASHSVHPQQLFVEWRPYGALTGSLPAGRSPPLKISVYCYPRRYPGQNLK
jgi:hypothetical protein